MLSSLFLSHNYSLYLYSGDLQTTTFGHTQLHKRLTEFLLTLYPLCLTLLYTHDEWRMFLKRSRLLENSIATACICAFSHLSIPFAFMLVVIGLLGSCSMYLLVCILFTWLVVCSLTSISCWCCWWFTCNRQMSRLCSC